MKAIRSITGALGSAALAMSIATAAHAEDLLGNQSTAAFADISDSQHSMTPQILGIVGFTVVVGMVIKWVRKAG